LHINVELESAPQSVRTERGLEDPVHQLRTI